MSMLKATKYWKKNGKRFTRIRTTHYITANEIEATIFECLSEKQTLPERKALRAGEADPNTVDLTKTEIEEKLRNQLGEYGQNWANYWTDNLPSDYYANRHKEDHTDIFDLYKSFLKAIGKRLFPSFYGTGKEVTN